MALINCPECGKENVSDSAVACPRCGFAIKEYFYKQNEKAIKQEELRIKRERELEEERDRQSGVPTPTKPVFNKGVIIYGIIALAFIIYCNIYTLQSVSGILMIVFHMLIFIGIPIWYFYRKYKLQMDEYNFAHTNKEQYQRMYLERLDKMRNNNTLKKQSYVFHYIISFLIPLVGSILGAILLSKNDTESYIAGKRSIILGIISVVISIFIIFANLPK